LGRILAKKFAYSDKFVKNTKRYLEEHGLTWGNFKKVGWLYKYTKNENSE